MALGVEYSVYHMFFFFFKQKTAYEMRMSDWSSDVCSSDLRSASVVAPNGIRDRTSRSTQGLAIMPNRKVNATSVTIQGSHERRGRSTGLSARYSFNSP